MPPLIGARVKRLEDEPLLRGRGRFVDDIALPGVWQAAFVRSPHPHALIKSINKSASRRRARRCCARRSRAGHGGAPHGAAFQLRHAAGQGLGLCAGAGRDLLRRRAGGDRSGRQPLSRRGPPSLVDVDYEPLPFVAVRQARDAAPVRRRPVQHRHHLQGRLWRRRRPSPRPRMCSSRSFGSTAAPPIRSRRAACSPRCAAPTAASPCMPRPRRRMIWRRR